MRLRIEVVVTALQGSSTAAFSRLLTVWAVEEKFELFMQGISFGYRWNSAVGDELLPLPLSEISQQVATYVTAALY